MERFNLLYFTLLAVYAPSMNFTYTRRHQLVTWLLAISGAISQFPVGKISDMYDRRKVIVFSTFGAALFAILAIIVLRQMCLPDGLATSKTWFYIFLILFSFCSFPMFSLILAHTNDYISKGKKSVHLLWIRCDEWSFLFTFMDNTLIYVFFVFLLFSFTI